MEPNQKELTIVDMNSEGVGIGKTDGLVVFVPGAVTGDTVQVQITEKKKNYAMGKCVTLFAPSSHRVAPDCPHYPSCGGCTLRHIDRGLELSVKENTVRQALRRMHLTVAEEDVCPILSTEEFGYRNKAVFHIDKTGAIGYYAKESHTILPGSTHCALLPKSMVQIADFTEAWLKEHPLRATSLYLRQNEKGECTATVQTENSWEREDQAAFHAYATALRQACPHVTGVLHSDSPKGKYAVPTYTVICGERYLHETYNGLTMRISPEGFCQVNKRGAELLAKTVLTFAETMSEKNVTAADLYCGSGFFGLQLAKAFPDWQLYGIEINPDSIRDAEVNRAENGLTNIRFQTGDAATMPKTNLHFAVIDPPRAGCSDKMRRQLLTLAPEKIAYVSCNPQTLARDLKALVEGGYRIEAVQPVDMFPRTEHCECVVLLTKIE